MNDDLHMERVLEHQLVILHKWNLLMILHMILQITVSAVPVHIFLEDHIHDLFFRISAVSGHGHLADIH